MKADAIALTKDRTIFYGSINNPFFMSSLSNPLPSDKYIIKTVDGLEPTPVTVTSLALPYRGSTYQNRKGQDREIAMTLKLNPNTSIGETAADLRANLYRMMTLGVTDTLQFCIIKDRLVIGYVECQVKNITPSLFDKDGTVQVVLTCFDPYFNALSLITKTDFPNPATYGTTNIINEGEARVGFEINIGFKADRATFTMYDSKISKRMTVEYPFKNGDILTINTKAGSRKIQVARSGYAPAEAINCLTFDSTWMLLYEGLNDFYLPGYDTGTFYVQSINYTPAFLGV